MASNQPAGAWSALRPYWRGILLGCVTIFLNPAFAVATPYFVGLGIDAIRDDHSDRAVHYALIAIALTAAQVVARALGFIFLQNTSRKAEHDLRIQLFAHLIRTDAAYFRAQRTGDLASRLSNDLTSLSAMWGGGLMWAIGMGALMILSVSLMVSIHPLLTVLALAPIPLVMWGINRVGDYVGKVSMEANKSMGKLSSAAHEDVAGIGVVKAYRLEEARGAQFETLSRDFVTSRLRNLLADGAMRMLLAVMAAASAILVLWIGGRAVIHGDMRLGELVQFNTYVAMLAVRVVGLGGSLPMFQRGKAAWTRLNEVLTRPAAIVDGGGAPLGTDVRGEIELRNLTIAVGDRTLLDNISLRIPANQVTAIVGRVGCGKSTLVDTIPRLIATPPGSVFLDGRDITELPLGDLRHAIAYAPQTAQLFSTSIADNIAFGIDDPGLGTRDRVIAASKAAGLEPDFAALPNGLDTQVGELGIGLSGGQRQRVALARAIASNRKIVILDDSLSALDTETERRVLDNLDVALRDRTVIMVSHRVAALQRAHQIVVLEAGKVVETGTHAELLARNGTYADIYRVQLEAEEVA